MRMEWEKEGAESWALPHYGPNQHEDSRLSHEEENKTANKDQHHPRSDGNRGPDLNLHHSKESIPSKNNLSNPRSADTKVVQVTSDTKQRLMPTATLAGGTQNLGKPVTHRSNATHRSVTGKGKVFVKPKTEFKSAHVLPKKKENHKAPTRDQPNTPNRPGDGGFQQKAPITGNVSFAKLKWRRGDAADASFRLPYEHRVFQEKFAKTSQGMLGNTNFCNRIIQQTGVYARIDVKNAKIIQIWGRESEVLAAKKLAQDFVDEVTFPSRSDNYAAPWSKVSAHSKTKIASEKFKEHCDAKVEGLRKPPKIPTGYTLIFLWPQRGPSLSHCLVSRRQILDDMRMTYDVNIYTRTGAQGCIFLSGDNEKDLCLISNKLRELWHDLYVQCETEIKLFLVEPPTANLMKTGIIVQRLNDFSKAFLLGESLTQTQVVSWNSCAQNFKQENKDVISGHLGRALRLVPHFDGLLQMRAKFGSFSFDEWRKPVTGSTYTFEEFRDMLKLGNVEGRLLPGICLPPEEIFKRIMKAEDLLIPRMGGRLDSLMTIVPKHSAAFEYQAKGNDMIRIEVEFSLPPGTGEFETNGIRCFKQCRIGTQSDPRKPMQIGMIDFERSDWQLEVKALTPLQGDEVSIELTRFKRSIEYNWNTSAKSIGSAPLRKASFSPGAPVTRFVEKSAIQLGVIDTPYIFELSRFDEYTSVKRQWTKIPKISWGGSLFNPEWDAILAEQTRCNIANMPPAGCLSSFFPAPPEAIEKAKEGMNEEEAEEMHEEIRRQKEMDQLKIFMSKVQTLARMLGSANFDTADVLGADMGALF